MIFNQVIKSDPFVYVIWQHISVNLFWQYAYYIVSPLFMLKVVSHAVSVKGLEMFIFNSH